MFSVQPNLIVDLRSLILNLHICMNEYFLHMGHVRTIFMGHIRTLSGTAPPCPDIGTDDDFDGIEHLLDDQKISVGDYLLVKFTTKKRVVHYVGKVEEFFDDHDYQMTFLRKNRNGFHFPNIADCSTISRSDIVSKLPKPVPQAGTSRTAAHLKFNVNFSGFYIE